MRNQENDKPQGKGAFHGRSSNKEICLACGIRKLF